VRAVVRARTRNQKNRETPKRNRLKFNCVIVKDLKPYCCLFACFFVYILLVISKKICTVSVKRWV